MWMVENGGRREADARGDFREQTRSLEIKYSTGRKDLYEERIYKTFTKH